MKKTNRNIKKVKFFRRLAVFIVVQLCIIAIAVDTVLDRQQVAYEDTRQVSFVADDSWIKWAPARRLGSTFVYIEHNEVVYKIGVQWRFQGSKKQLVEDLATKEATLRYDIDTLEIVDIRVGETTYLTFEDYNKEQKSQLVAGLAIGLPIMEAAWCLAAWFCLGSRYYELWGKKRKYKRKSKKKAEM